MKKIFFTIFVLGVLVIMIPSLLTAQNSLEISYGLRKPIGNSFGDAFNATDGWGLSFLHKPKGANWSFGATLGEQKFSSSSSFFGVGYRSSLQVNNLLFSLRKDIRLHQEHSVYFGADMGLAYYKYHWNKSGTKDQVGNTGFVTGILLGTDWTIDSRFSIDLNAGWHYTYTDELNLDNQIIIRKLKYLGINLGVKYQLNH